MALVDRINTMNGLSNTAATVTQLLNNEAPGYIRYIPDDIVRQFTSESTDSGTGVSLGSGRFVDAHKTGRRAKLRDAAEKAALDDVNSMHLATALSPACYVENGKAYVKPSGGTVVAVLATTLNSSSDDAISFLPVPLGDAVQIKVAWRLLAYAIFGNTAPYDRPVAPTIEYIPAGFAAMLTATMGAVPSVPTYTTQTVSGDFTTALTDMETALDADDIEIAGGRSQKASLYLEDLSTRIANNRAALEANVVKFNGDMAKLQGDLNALIEKYRLDAQQETNVDLQNQIQKAQVELQNYSLSLQRYQGQVQAGLNMLGALWQQHEVIMASYARPEKAVQKVYPKQPLEVEA